MKPEQLRATLQTAGTLTLAMKALELFPLLLQLWERSLLHDADGIRDALAALDQYGEGG